MNSYDAVIVGGGPAGSAAGSLLSQGGKSVLIVEREVFPRFHIGESLIPFGNDVLRDMGVWDSLKEAGFIVKPGAEFTLANSCGFQRFWFRNNFGPDHATTFQVERAKFDTILLDHARKSGCKILQPSIAQNAKFFPDHVELTFTHENKTETVKAHYLIDATGRDAWLGKKLSLPKTDLGMPKKMAVYAHVEGAFRNEGEAAGNITIIRMENGWFWMIPLDEKKTSIGVVMQLDTLKSLGPDLETRFWNRIRSSDEATFRLKNAKVVGDYHVTTDYTYRHYQNASDRWFLAGDAAGFIDPIFSSGVMVALRSGRMAAQTILSKKDSSPLSAAEQKTYTREFRKMTGVFIKMIQLFYDNEAFAIFMNPRSLFRLNETINRLVAGQTNLPWTFQCRFWIFQLLSWLQRYITIAPPLIFENQKKK